MLTPVLFRAAPGRIKMVRERYLHMEGGAWGPVSGRLVYRMLRVYIQKFHTANLLYPVM